MKFTTLAVTCALAVGFSLPAIANQTSPSSSANGNSSTPGSDQSSMNSPALRQQMTNDLQKAGFSDVKVMPQSFLVRAKDKEGRPVMMVINPDSILSVTQVSSPEKAGSGGKSGTDAGSGNTSASK